VENPPQSRESIACTAAPLFPGLMAKEVIPPGLLMIPGFGKMTTISTLISRIEFCVPMGLVPASWWVEDVPSVENPLQMFKNSMKSATQKDHRVFELKVISHFSAAHQLRDYVGGCERLHGHNWKVEVYVESENVGQDGLVMDFRVIKESTRSLLEELDHKFLNEVEYFKTVNPSSENIARFIFESLSRLLDNEATRVSKVTAWESDSACSSYMRSR
jgi:6-pyruvoyltetrahydropterin/6-carboxytetrahydropterin synthase